MISTPRPFAALAVLLAALPWMPGGSPGADQNREEGQFDIYVSGKSIGRERFQIVSSPDSSSSTSTMEFQDPAHNHEKVRIETSLGMGESFLPKSYQLRTNIGGRKVTMNAAFTPGEASFTYQVSGAERKSKLLVGDRYLVLDTNVFHHFVFLARLFDFTRSEPQSFEVVIPQELDNGVLRVTQFGKEKVPLHGKSLELYHLKVDSGSLTIDLWVDQSRTLYKIALPGKGIEVIRNTKF